MRTCGLIQTSVDLAGCIQIRDKYIVAYLPITAHIGHNDSVKRGVEEHTILYNQVSCYFPSDKSDGFVGRWPYRHNPSCLAPLGAAETRSGRVGFGIFVDKTEIEKDAVDNYFRCALEDRLYQYNSSPD